MPAVTEAIGALISIHAPLAGCDRSTHSASSPLV